MKKTLEEIFYKNGKFLFYKRNKIKPETVGTPVSIMHSKIQIDKDKIIEEYQSFIKNNKINAYIIGDSNSYSEKFDNKIVYFTSLQFYKKNIKK